MPRAMPKQGANSFSSILHHAGEQQCHRNGGEEIKRKENGFETGRRAENELNSPLLYGNITNYLEVRECSG